MPLPTKSNSLEAAGLDQTAALVEVFSALQGEGLNVGTRQIFVRFGGCDLRCSYCDSAHTWHPTSRCDIEVQAGQRRYEQHPNPVSGTQLLAWIDRLDQPRLHDSISLTGGEPLLQSAFLAQFLPQLRSRCSLPLYLETGGHRADLLPLVLPYLDWIGMDLKLPSVSRESHWEAHRQFLVQAAKVEVFCKLIISSQTQWLDLEKAAALIRSVSEEIPCFLQPMTPLGEADSALAPRPEQVLEWHGLMKQILRDVRVIPQTHKMMHQK
ncbi:7-carboxy-7-deazaguanine synthase QueE [Lyngbya confervoides]|uniref:7-carboxy-7-deazaguanine synthase n=1 Tax=Lyngbya confervoides BDU141951 TaxID=1574623 RepID=A0ABD4T759_9CYAN|nr:7-carboxy-7-deazaguanine synthase QueE [Lyngbya confervoides]MCM1984085.1 7-carboxy-7-deazaguanine synthase QueE [Lyngbya confervoides BDU141951]